MKAPLFEGVCTALVTPFDENGIHERLLGVLIERQIAAGVPALVVAGTTGESAALSHTEKLRLFEKAAALADGRCLILAGTGSNNTRTAAALSREAGKTGTHGLLCVTPYYNKCTQEGLYRHYLTILDNTDLPVLLYNVPSRTGISLEPETCARLCVHPNCAGLKEADPDVGKLFRLRSCCGADFPVYCGNDDRIVPFYAAGAKGVVSVWSNLFPEAAVRLCRLCREERFEAAAKLQTEAQPLLEALFSVVNPIPVKAALRVIGYDCGPCRPPLDDCPQPLVRRLEALLQNQKLDSPVEA